MSGTLVTFQRKLGHECERNFNHFFLVNWTRISVHIFNSFYKIKVLKSRRILIKIYFSFFPQKILDLIFYYCFTNQLFSKFASFNCNIWHDLISQEECELNGNGTCSRTECVHFFPKLVNVTGTQLLFSNMNVKWILFLKKRNVQCSGEIQLLLIEANILVLTYICTFYT